MKRVLALILASIMLMSVAGCTPYENEVVDLQRGPAKGSEAVNLLAEAVYPEMAPYPNEIILL